jgi:hypothetical protein
MKILVRTQKEKDWRLVESAAYGKEAELQKLLAESPALISMDEIRPGAAALVLAAPEFPLPVGSIDLLAFSPEGDIAVIECKLASNAEIKRKVIGQVLEYGANLWEMSYAEVDERVRLRMGESLAELVKDAVQTPDWDEEAFRLNVESALASGNFILLIVVDEFNDELSRMIRYVNSCGSPGFSLAALEMRKFQSGSMDMLVPRVFGPVRTPKAKSGDGQKRQWDEESFFPELKARHGDEACRVAQGILAWVKENTSLWWGQGKRSGSFIPFFPYNEKNNPLFAVWTYGVVEVYFYWLATKPPFDSEEKRRELLERLNQIPGVSLPPDSINRRPSFKLSALAVDGALEQFLAVYDWVMAEIRRT